MATAAARLRTKNPFKKNQNRLEGHYGRAQTPRRDNVSGGGEYGTDQDRNVAVVVQFRLS